MSKRRHVGLVALILVAGTALAGCSSDPTTSPLAPTQALTAAAPTIAVTVPYYFRSLCYPARAYSTRGCPSGGTVTITNSGGGTLTWTSSRNVTWLRRSLVSGTAPSTVRIWVDGAALPPGTYDGQVKIWARGATNSPRTIFVHVTRD
jgi:hypothetical protein